MTHRPLGEYSAARFLEYALYPPLYLAGPTLTFNAFASQRRAPRDIGIAQVLPPILLAELALAFKSD